MSLQESVQLIRQQWLPLVAGALVGLMVAMCVTWLTPQRYTSQVTLTTTPSAVDTDAGAEYEAVRLAQEKVKSYVELLREQRLAREASGRLGGAVPPQDILESVSASAVAGTTVIRLGASDTTPEGAQRIASAVADSSVGLVAQLEQPRPPPARVVLDIVGPASFNPTPVSRPWFLDLALGLVLGLAGGLLVALARMRLDKSLTEADRLAAIVGAPVLGTIGRDASTAAHLLVVRDDPSSPEADTLRQLARTVEFVDVDQAHKVLVATAAREGHGTVAAVVNLAMALRRDGKTVALVDADLRSAALGVDLGLHWSTGLTTALTRRATLDEALQPSDEGACDVLPSGTLPPDPAELLSSGRMADLLAELRQRYDVVLLHAPPLGAVPDAATLARTADGAMLFVRYRRSTENDVRCAVTALREAGATVFGTVLTFAPPAGAPRSLGPAEETERGDEPDTPGSSPVWAPPGSGADR